MLSEYVFNLYYPYYKYSLASFRILRGHSFVFSIDPKVSRIQRNEWLMAVFQTGASGKEIREMESISFCLLHPHGTQTSQLLLPRANLLSDLRGCGGGWEECCFWLEDDEVFGEKAVCPLCALDPN